MSIDEKHQKITIQNYFQMRWTNEMLRWNPHDFGNITRVPVTPDQVSISKDILRSKCFIETKVSQKISLNQESLFGV